MPRKYRIRRENTGGNIGVCYYLIADATDIRGLIQIQEDMVKTSTGIPNLEHLITMLTEQTPLQVSPLLIHTTYISKQSIFPSFQDK